MSKYEIVGVAISALAPCSPILFFGIDFTVFGCRITQDNFIGIFLAIVAALFWMTCFFGLHNLTTDPVFEHVKPEIFPELETQKSNNETDLLKIKDVLKNGNLVLVYAAQVLAEQCFYQLELVLTMYAILVYKFTLVKLGIVTAIAVLISISLMFSVRKRIVSSMINVYFVLIHSFILMCLLVSLFLLVDSLELKQFTFQALFVLTALLLINCFGSGVTIVNRLLAFSVTPSHSASIVDSYCYVVGSASITVSYFTASLVFSNLVYVLPVFFVVYYLFIWIFVARRHAFLMSANENIPEENH